MNKHPIIMANFDKIVFIAGFGLTMAFINTLGTYIYYYIYELTHKAFREKSDLEIILMMFLSYMSGWLLAKKL